MARNALVGIAAAITLCAGTSMALAQVGTDFTFQGQLKDSGTAVNGTADMQFSLWTAASGGSQVGFTVTKLAVPASEGLVTTSVDFGANPYGADQALYLQVSVRTPAGAGAYVPMTSRQKLTAAPFSLATRGINVNSIGDVAVGGATEALVKLKVTGNDPAFGSVRIMDDANDGDMTFDGGNDGGAADDDEIEVTRLHNEITSSQAEHACEVLDLLRLVAFIENGGRRAMRTRQTSGTEAAASSTENGKAL